MATLSDALHPPAMPLHDALAAGLDILSQNQTVTFRPYVRAVMPLDSYVFWINCQLLTPQQLAQHGLANANPVIIQGSLHYATQGSMVEDETIVVRSVDFTAESPIAAFGTLTRDVMYVAEWTTALGTFHFTFSRRNAFYVQAGIHHYVGDAVYPAFVAMLIDDVSQFDQRQIVSNSLPLWLTAFQSVPFPSLVTTPLAVYPAFLVPENLTPAYGVIDIRTDRTLQASPNRDSSSSHFQLCVDHVRLVMYGLYNDDVMNLMDYIIDYSVNTGQFGFMSSGPIRDEPRTQVELAALAMKKSWELDVSYYQSSMRDIARQYISSSIPAFSPQDIALVPVPPLIVPGYDSLPTGYGTLR